MYWDTVNWLKACKNCAMKKAPVPARAPLQPINEAKFPFDMLGVDILGPLTETKDGHKYILVFTDYLSRWAEAFALKRIDSKSIAKIFLDEIVCKYSAPATLLSDQGAQFMSFLMKEVCELLKTRKLNTTAYHPQCNGLTERFNATLCQLLAMFSNEGQTDWDQFIAVALFAYNTSVQQTTELSPFEVLFGRPPRLPCESENVRSVQDEFVVDFRKRWGKAQNRIEKAGIKKKENMIRF
jgi:hypothetical protein